MCRQKADRITEKKKVCSILNCEHVVKYSDTWIKLIPTRIKKWNMNSVYNSSFGNIIFTGYS